MQAAWLTAGYFDSDWGGMVTAIKATKIGARATATLLAGTMLSGMAAAQTAPQTAPAAAPPAAQAAPAPAVPAPVTRTIKSIRVQGSQRIESETVMSYTRLRVGDAYTNETIDQAIKDLLASELLADVTIEGVETGDLVIRIRENPVINRVIYEGNKRLKEDKIKKEVKLAPRQIFTRTAVRADVAPGERFGVGLRLSGQALEEASASEAMAAMKAFLAENDLYVFTMNAFPYGPFHGTRVKEEVYLPDWRDNERLRYTNAAADYLAEILPEGLVGSISTAPGCYKTNVDGDAVAQMTERFVQHAAHLVAIERRTGKTIALAIEPEPSCFLETTEEAVAFFRDHLFAPAAAGRLAELTGLSAEEAGRALRKHLGLCLDLCHAAVEFEDPAATDASLREAGVAVTKLQVSAGLRLAGVGAEARALLAPFEIPSYRDWLLTADHRPSYEAHKRTLQHLQFRHPGRWVLKYPKHVFALDALIAVYPDARLIWTHRDPIKIIPSVVSLIGTFRSATPGYDPKLLGRSWSAFEELGLRRGLDVRASLFAPGKVYDMQYRDVTRDPVAAIAAAYNHFGMTLSETSGANIRTFLADNAKDKHGAHHYTAEEYGLTDEMLRSTFKGYVDRFQVA